jgi:NTE family protein
MKTFALALGSGGARGLAHVAVVEALDDMGVRPTAIAGSSIGALIGAAYAAGMTGKEIRRFVTGLAHDRNETTRRLIATRAGKLSELFASGLSHATQIDAEKFCAQFLPGSIPDDFSALHIPLTVMATDFNKRQETPLTSGPLRPALAASIAIPGLLRPVTIDGRIFIDGAATNPVPFDVLRPHADCVLAVDVLGGAPADGGEAPGVWHSVTATFSIMGSAILAAKLALGAPDILIRPNVGIFRTLDFYQATAILRSADAVKTDVKRQLAAALAD